MSKEKKSKLDAFTERLDQWFGVEKKTIAEVQEQLRLDGCEVSAGRLSVWWSERQSRKLQEGLLAQIASGAQAVQEVEAEFAKSPAPGMETLIKLHRVLILKLSTLGHVEPEYLKLADQLLRTAMEYISGQTKAQHKERELHLTEEKHQIATCEFFLKWFLDKAAQEIASSSASNAEKIAQLRKQYFSSVDALQASGKVVLPA